MAAYFRKYRVTVPSGLCLLAYLAASAAGLFNRMLALRVENALHLNGFVNTVNGYQALATLIASAARSPWNAIASSASLGRGSALRRSIVR